MSTKKEETMSTTTDLRQGFVNSMNKKMVAEVHVIRRSADGGEVKEFTSFLSQADYKKVYGGIGQGDHYSRGTIFPGVLVGGDVVGYSYQTMMFTLGDDWSSDWGMHFIDSRGVRVATLLVRGGEPVRC